MIRKKLKDFEHWVEERINSLDPTSNLTEFQKQKIKELYPEKYDQLEIKEIEKLSDRARRTLKKIKLLHRKK